MEALAKFKSVVHDKLNDIRRLDYLLNDPDFLRFWQSLTPEVKNKIIQAQSFTITSEYFKKGFKRPLAEMTRDELRDLARRRGVNAFMQMTKSTLLSEVSKLEGLNYD